MTWTPYQIEVILHHHCSTADFPRATFPEYSLLLSGLMEAGVLYRDASSLIIATTPLGAALVACWAEQPLPVVRYVDPRLVNEGE